MYIHIFTLNLMKVSCLIYMQQLKRKRFFKDMPEVSGSILSLV